MDGGDDFLAACDVGTVLRTRDRRDAKITRIDRAAGLIHGEVTMFGACRWRANGIYADAPAGAAGPLDLVAPPAAMPARQRHVSVTDHLDGEGRAFCCD
jgi:hypothetical protein